MTEYELVYFLAEARDRAWLMIQIWAGISFGYMAYAQFSSKNLNALIVTVLSFLYASFSILMFRTLSAVQGVIDGCRAGLQELASKQALTQATEAFFAIDGDQVARISALIAVFGTATCAFLFLPYTYINAKRENT